MSMVCPQCNSVYVDRQRCPTCGLALVGRDLSGMFGTEAKWQQTAWGRGIAGLLLAQGLYYGLWQLGTAVVVASVHEGGQTEWWSTPTGWVLLQILQAVSLLLGGVLAGAGQKRGPIYGAFLGMVNGILFVLVQQGVGREVSDLEMLGQPLLQALLGAVGGLVGSMIWRPMVSVALPPGTAASSMFQQQQRAPMPALPVRPAPFSGPIAWVRVVGGSVLALIGSAWANLILKMMLDFSEHRLSVASIHHAQFVTWEISVLVLLLGSALAGSNTRNGVKQGLLVGTGTALGLLAIHLYLGSGGSVPAQTLCFTLMNIELTGAPEPVQTIVFTLLTVVPMGMLGGWFGGQLLPPVMGPPRRGSLFAAQV